MSDPGAYIETLDTEELLRLALDAIDTGDGDKVVAYLRRLLAIEPDHGMALYLLGAQHAQMQLYDRAIAEIARAVEVEPDIPPTAHFQLGLLHLTCGEVPQAMTAWSPLDALEEEAALFRFRRGLTALIRDDFAACIADLEAGITSNDLYPVLNNDMRLLLERAQQVMNAEPVTDDRRAFPPDRARRVNLSAYESGSDD